MKPIMTAYPGFHDLPKGIRKMLLISESHFFEQLCAPGEPALVPQPAATPPINHSEPAANFPRADARPP